MKYFSTKNFRVNSLLFRRGVRGEASWMKYFFAVTILFLSAINYAGAQTVLSLEEAIATAMKNNYDILISKSESDIATNNLFIGNAGMLPSLSLDGGYTQSIGNTHLEYASGDVTDRNNASAHNLNAGANLSWTLFDGMKMFVTYQQLQLLKAKGETDLKNTLQQTVLKVTDAYYNVVLQQQLLRVYQFSDSISDWRMSLAQKKWDVGSGSKLDFLQAKVDHNADRSAVMQQQVVLQNAKVDLNNLLARDITTDFKTIDSITAVSTLTLEQIQTQTFEQNPELTVAEQSRRISDLTIQQLQGGYYPTVSLNGSYGYNNATTQAGFLLNNKTSGPSFGLSASWNLFNGNRQSHIVQDAKINSLISNYQYAQVKSKLTAQVQQAYYTYQNNLKLLLLEEENTNDAKENLAIAVDRYKLGSSNALDFKNAQQSFIAQQTRLFNARYNAKISEIELLSLSGGIVK